MMKVLRRVCRNCGHVALFSVQVVSLPNSAEHFGEFCPFCRTTTTPAVFFCDEIDLVEVNTEPVDVEAIRKTIDRILRENPPGPGRAKDPLQ